MDTVTDKVVCAVPPSRPAPSAPVEGCSLGEDHACVPCLGPAARGSCDGAGHLLPHPAVVPAAIRHLLPEQGPVCSLCEHHGWSSSTLSLLSAV